jgi:hypothetical protein
MGASADASCWAYLGELGRVAGPMLGRLEQFGLWYPRSWVGWHRDFGRKVEKNRK